MPPHNKSRLPKVGKTSREIRELLESAQPDPVRTHWSKVFRGPEDVQEIGRMAYNMFMSHNGLFAMRHAYFGDVETELLEMCTSLFNPTPDSCANLTSGGSESIYSAIHAVREWARVKYPHISEPEIIAPYSAHPTFSKGCHYFGLKLTRTGLGNDLRADVAAMKDAINENTVCLVGSAPCWPYGLYDNIRDIAALAKENGLWMHTDACVGGYLAPFVEELGYPIPPWDFRVPGVMSISADLHKLGFCLKPASTVLWRSAELQQYHYVHPADWPCGEYAMTGFAGSRTGGPVFAAWAILQYLGREGYLQLAQKLMETKQSFIDGINAIGGLRAWENDLLPLVFEATAFDLQAVAAELNRKGWILVGCKEPPLISLPIDAAVTDEVRDTFLADLAAAAESARATESVEEDSLAY